MSFTLRPGKGWVRKRVSRPPSERRTSKAPLDVWSDRLVSTAHRDATPGGGVRTAKDRLSTFTPLLVNLERFNRGCG